MGWCSGTEIFDMVVGALLDKKKGAGVEAVISKLIDALEDQDWDCQSDSEYYDTIIVQKIMRQKHPKWFEEE